MGETRVGAAGRMDGLLRRTIEYWALLGGIVLLGIALMSTWSAASGFLFQKPVPGDFEMVEVMVAIAAFSFLPYCELSHANVTADIFTSKAGPRAVAVFNILAGVVALVFSVILFWRMYAGLLDYRQYVETTTILKFPIWVAYIPALISLVLLAVASLISLKQAIGEFMNPN
ncbi:MAG: TRAP transporter small permease [Betaproteobacteria bacterium]|nr:TRAP transporter small permease [Betaproteobacteria bacterium]